LTLAHAANGQTRTSPADRLDDIIGRFERDAAPVLDFLGGRPDLVGDEVSRAILRCGSRFPAARWSALRPAAEAAVAPAAITAVDETPIWTRWWGQAHAVTLDSGASLLLVLRRPEASEILARNLSGSDLFRRVLGALDGETLEGLEEAFAAWLDASADLSRHARNASRLARTRQAGDLYRAVSPVADVAVGALAFPFRAPPAPAGPAAEIDNAQTLLAVAWSQATRAGWLQADLRRENLRFGGGALEYAGFADCHPIGRQDARDVADLLAAAYGRDAEALADIWLELTAGDAAAERDPAEIVDELTGSLAHEGGASDALAALLRRARREGQPPPAGMAAACRAVILAERTAETLSAPATVAALGKARFGPEARDQEERAVDQFLAVAGPGWVRLLARGPSRIAGLLDDLGEGRLSLRVESTEGPELRRVQRGRTRLLALAVVSVGLAMVAALPQPEGREAIRLVSGAALLAVYAAIAVLWLRLK
jgi:hypothetical protein